MATSQKELNEKLRVQKLEEILGKLKPGELIEVSLLVGEAVMGLFQGQMCTGDKTVIILRRRSDLPIEEIAKKDIDKIARVNAPWGEE